ncbi:MAG: hypothetical protein C4321_06120, partial [Chloroflexota bacterium]
KEDPNVNVPLISKRDDPILATWRYGLGRSIAFTSDAKNRWAANWIDWPGYAKFWSQAVRWTIRSSSRANFETTVEVARRRGRVTIDALDNNGSFINGLDVRGSAVSPKMKSLPLKIAQVAPGRYEASFDAPEVGPYIISLGYKDQNGNQKTQTTGAVVPYSPEYRELEANTATLTRLTEMTGGEMYPALSGPADSKEHAPFLNRVF